VTGAPQRCGYVAILGRPNVGKSTLLNVVLSQKISITSRKPQTTRHNLLGIDTDGARQAIYVDTPGIHAGAAREMNRRMVRAAASVVADVDLVVMLVDRGRWTAEDDLVLRPDGFGNPDAKPHTYNDITNPEAYPHLQWRGIKIFQHNKYAPRFSAPPVLPPRKLFALHPTRAGWRMWAPPHLIVLA